VAGQSDMRGAAGLARRFIADDRGAIAPMVGMSLALMLAVGGLAWDVSRGFALRAELEAAADAAALAGATQLDGATGARGRATTTAQGSLVKNGQRLADTAEANSTSNADITYLVDLTNRTVAANDAEANFIQVNITPRNMGLVFGAFTAVANFQVRAHAVAGYGSAICKTPPLMVCNPDETQSANIFNGYAGRGIVLNGKGGSGAFAPGNFGYLQITGGNLNALKDAMGRSPPLSECFGDSVETRTGDPTAVLDYLNTRFDIYDSGLPNSLKSDQFYAPAPVSITGLARTSGGSTSLCKPGAQGTAYNGSASGVVAMPLPRDTCAYPTGGSTCTGGASAVGNGDWDRTNYFNLTHNWTGSVASAPFTGDAWSSFYDYPGVATKPTYPTRYQVYLWETANIGNASIWGPSPVKNPPVNTNPSQNIDWATRQCSTATPISGIPDRRTISALILNCSQIQNNKPSTVIGAVDLFLTEPAAISGNGIIYAEIISATTDASAVGKETKLFSVRLYE
jgi:Flp pilus assembly protein TadG